MVFHWNQQQSGSDVTGYLQNKTLLHIHSQFENFGMWELNHKLSSFIIYRLLCIMCRSLTSMRAFECNWSAFEWFLGGIHYKVGRMDRIFTKQDFTPYPFTIRKFWNVGTQPQTVFFHYLSFALHYVSFVNFYEGF